MPFRRSSKGYLAVGGLFLAATGIFLRAEAPARRASTYADGRYGFSIVAPDFPEAPKGAQVTRVMMFAPAEGGLSANGNVTVIPGKTTREEVIEDNQKQIKAAGWKLNATTELGRSGRDSALFDYEGMMGGVGQEMRWLCLIVVDEDRQLCVTCTAPKATFPKYEKAFRASLESFKLEG